MGDKAATGSEAESAAAAECSYCDPSLGNRKGFRWKGRRKRRLYCIDLFNCFLDQGQGHTRHMRREFLHPATGKGGPLVQILGAAWGTCPSWADWPVKWRHRRRQEGILAGQ